MFRRRHDEDARYFFVHLQKTAGTSLYFQLREAMGARAVYPDRARGDYDDVSDKAQPVIAVDHLERRWAARRREIRMVTGHFPLCTTELLDAGFTTLHPAPRPGRADALVPAPPSQALPGRRMASLEEIYADAFRFHGLVHNHMVKMFSLPVDEMDGGAMTPVDFSRATSSGPRRTWLGSTSWACRRASPSSARSSNARFGWNSRTPST